MNSSQKVAMQNRLLRHAKQLPFTIKILLLGVMAWGLFDAFNSSLKESAFALWFLGLAVFITSWRTYRPSKISAFTIKGFAFGLVALSFVSSYFGVLSLSIFLIAFAFGVFFDRLKVPQKLIIPFLIWIVAIPNCEYLHLLVSHPMRVMGAIVSAGVLNILGISASAAGTMINIDGAQVAITTACSGIEQLEAMLLIGWICAAYMHKKVFLQVTHFLMIIPIILAANILRLIVTLLGAHKYGDVFLSDKVHTTFGFATVILVLLIFVGVGELLSEKPEPKTLESKEGK